MNENPHHLTPVRPQISADEVNPLSMMFDPVIADRVMAIAKTMAAGKVSMPDHLRGNVGDCLAIVMLAASWHLNPFAVAQKTHLIHGQLGYEAQLVSAVVSSLGLLDGGFSYEFIGDWRKLAKRPKIAKGSRGSFPEPSWREQDEEGLSLIVRAKLKGDPNVKELELLLASVWPRNSSLWATAPQQQAVYLATKQWVRRYAPNVILGVYTPDELERKREREHRVIDDLIDRQNGSIAETITRAAYEQPTNSAQETKSEPKNQIEWPQERDGVLFDIRGIPWTGEIHSSLKTCTRDGMWRKRRGISSSIINTLENKLLPAEAAEHQDQKETESVAPSEPASSGEDTQTDEKFYENLQKYFNERISQAQSEEEIEEYEKEVRDSEFPEEIETGLEFKIAARRAELAEAAE